ncbi:MAG TPA: MFS transporter, partial [Clostridiales bacterium]|nr:MFS transporter [Clostridiales bacterium]
MNKRSGDRSATVLFAFFWFAYSATYIGRLNYSACMPAIMAELHLSKAFAGAVGTGFLAFYAVGQLLNGLIGDKISPKYMIGAGLFGAGTANLFMGFNTFVPLMPVIWCFNGYCSAMLWSPLIRAISEWLPQHRQTRAGVGIASTIPAGTIASYLSSALILR